MRLLELLGKGLSGIYRLLFSRMEERDSVRRHEAFEGTIRKELGGLLDDPSVRLERGKGLPPPPFNYVTAKLRFPVCELEIVDGRDETVLSFASICEPGRSILWENFYAKEGPREEAREASVYRCVLYIREHWKDWKEGRRPS